MEKHRPHSVVAKILTNGPATTLLICGIMVVIWETAVRLLEIKPYILPTPTSVALQIVSKYGILFHHSFVTISEALLGFLLALLLGVLGAIFLQLSPRVDEAVQPIVAGFQSFPKEAIAPLMVVWFGFGITSKVILACSIAFFPVFVSMLKGLKSVPDDVMYTFLSLRATRQEILLKARIPFSLPHLFSGMRVASTLSIVGAVIGEFIGASKGLGHLILMANSEFSVDLVFASLLFLAVIGVVLDILIRTVERYLLPWHESVSGIQGIGTSI